MGCVASLSCWPRVSAHLACPAQSRISRLTLTTSACSAAAARLYYSIDLYRTKDFTWGATMMGMWVAAEICSGFLVACIPVLPRFFKSLPFLVRMGSSIRTIFRFRNSASAKRSTMGPRSDEEYRAQRGPIVTDIEFEELVRRTDFNLVTVEHLEAENQRP